METTAPEVTTVPTTEETVPTTEEPTQTEELISWETEPVAEESRGGGIWVPLLIISLVLTAGILGVLIFKGSRGGKYAD